MALVNLLSGTDDDSISRNVGMSPTNTYDIGVTSLDVLGNGAALVASPRNIVCSGLIGYGTTVASFTEGMSKNWPEYTPVMIISAGSLSAATITMPALITAGTKVTLGIVAGSIATLTMNANGSIQTLYNPLTSISAGQFGSWQAILLGGHYYWARVG